MRKSIKIFILLISTSIIFLGCWQNKQEPPQPKSSPTGTLNWTPFKDFKEPLEDFFKDPNSGGIYMKPGHDLVGQSHTAGSGQEGGHGVKMMPPRCLQEKGISKIKAYFFMSIHDSNVETEGKAKVEFKIFKDNNLYESSNIEITLKGNNGTRTERASIIDVNGNDYIDKPDTTHYVNFEVTAEINAVVSEAAEYHIVMEIRDHHPNLITVERDAQGRLVIVVVPSINTLLPYECIGKTGLARYNCIDSLSDNWHIRNHVEIQKLTLCNK